LRLEGLVFVIVLGVRDGRVVALVLVLRWVLLLWQTLMFWAVAVYPALLVAPLRAHSSELGPTVLSLERGSGRKLRRVALILHVFGRHLGCFLLEEWVEIVLVVLVGGREMRAGSLALVPLRSLQSSVLLRLLLVLILEGSRITATH
jgi:hypothetical protein